jgi:protein-S-isoprenylcysteine O-methyltransferase Ste14
LSRTDIIMRIPPPLMFVASFFGGIGMQGLLPLPLYPARQLAIGQAAGFILIAASAVLMLSAVIAFMLARTTLVPFGAASKLVVRGPFRFTRNPMYVGLVVAYLGAAIVIAAPWPLLLLPLPIALIQRVVIPFEETRLRQIFGDGFERYCGKVHRWL